jgi:hypothetical protein
MASKSHALFDHFAHESSLATVLVDHLDFRSGTSLDNKNIIAAVIMSKDSYSLHWED